METYFPRKLCWKLKFWLKKLNCRFYFIYFFDGRSPSSQDINWISSISRCIYGTFPWRNLSPFYILIEIILQWSKWLDPMFRNLKLNKIFLFFTECILDRAIILIEVKYVIVKCLIWNCLLFWISKWGNDFCLFIFLWACDFEIFILFESWRYFYKIRIWF